MSQPKKIARPKAAKPRAARPKKTAARTVAAQPPPPAETPTPLLPPPVRRPARARNADAKRNAYEITRDEFAPIERECRASAAGVCLGRHFVDLVLEYLMPYVCRWMPYQPDFRMWSAVGRALAGARFSRGVLARGLPLVAVERVLGFLRPRVVLTEPIPCAITTISHIADFDYDQAELIAAVKARGAAGAVDPQILAVYNKCGSYFANGVPAKFALFGTSQTTFKVCTQHREPDKVFAVKVFQKNVSLETLGGLWVDCRDTRDVNDTVLKEIRAALGRPNLVITNFCASMRNYRFHLATTHNVQLYKVLEICQRLQRTTHPHLYASVDISRHPSAILEIDAPRHTSKKRKVVIKVFQSGKVNIDSCVYYEHVHTWYRFINEFLIEHAAEVLYMPPAAGDEYDSDYYYREADVEPPPRELVYDA